MISASHSTIMQVANLCIRPTGTVEIHRPRSACHCASDWRAISDKFWGWNCPLFDTATQLHFYFWSVAGKLSPCSNLAEPRGWEENEKEKKGGRRERGIRGHHRAQSDFWKSLTARTHLCRLGEATRPKVLTTGRLHIMIRAASPVNEHLCDYTSVFCVDSVTSAPRHGTAGRGHTGNRRDSR